MSRPPRIRISTKQLYTLPFSGTVALATQLTLLSSPIPFPFIVKSAEMVFSDEAMNQVRHYWLWADNDTVSTIAVPDGLNIFSRLAPTGYFIGHALIRRVEANLRINSIGARIKLHTNNLLNSAYDISASMTIQEA